MKFILSMLVTILFFFGGLSVFVEKRDEMVLGERRKRATLPDEFRLTKRELTKFFRRLDFFYADNIPYREKILSLTSRLIATTGGSLNTDKCLRGKQNWLFLGNDYGNCVDKLTGRRMLTPRELARQTEKYTAKIKAFQDQGIPFYLIVGPNKSTIYQEFLPNIVRPAKHRYITPLFEALQSSGAHLVDPTEALLQAKADKLLYFRTDTHWNSAGCWVAAQCLMKAMGWEPPPAPNLIDAGVHKGDLLTIGGYFDNFSLTRGDYFTPAWPEPIPQRPTRVWLFGDSFSNDLMPYIKAVAPDATRFALNDLEQTLATKRPLPDAVVYVVVERNFAD